MNKQTFLWGKLPEGWKLVELKDVSSYISRGKQPKYLENSDIRALNQKAVRWGEIDESVLKYHNPSVNIDEKHFIKQNDVVINSTGTGTAGRTYHFKYTPEKMFADSHITIVRTNEEILNSRFLMYQLSTKEYQNHIESAYLAGSTGQVEFNKSKVQQLPIVLPTIEEQEKIVDILSSLDNKIELNNEMNKTLEEMAQSIFKRWFVDFEFPNEDGETYKSSGGEMVDSELGMIPKGWEVKTIGDIGDVISGGTPSTKNEEYYGGDISWITPKDLSGYDRKFISKGERSITEIGLQKSSAKLLPRGTVLFSSRAPIGYVAIAQQEVCTNQGFKSIVCNKDIINNNYIYYFLKYNKENIENVSSGSTFKEISGTHMKNIKIIVPIKNILDKFNGVIESFDKLLDKNYMDIDILTEVRDNLLPKLMSGEIKV